MSKNINLVKSDIGNLFEELESVAKEAKLEDVREQLVSELSHEKAVDQVFTIANKLEDAIGSGATIEVAGRNVGLTVKKIAAVDAGGHGGARRGRDARGRAVVRRLGPLSAGGRAEPVALRTSWGEDGVRRR